ncbi:MAG: branched-chain amino acid ABC transporter permease [Actinomycetales bacterium]|nr:branched-chain amino acid ABC transporter permease [Aeromicrobium sp. Leaf289]RYY50755.1 MAG: branched-chain amino acid ABC transporter permease [Actinomycetales bacterium]
MSDRSPEPPSAARRRVVADSLGVGVATGLYGVSFGALGTASGLSVLQTCVLSLVAFTGASQFAFIGVVAAGGAPLTGALTSVLLGTRNLFYGLSLASILRLTGVRRTLGAHLVIDESTAVAVAQRDHVLGRLGFWWTGASIYLLWNLSTLAGALAGTAIGDPRTYGLDAAVGAAFLALLWPRLSGALARVVALVGAGVALGLVPLSPAGVPIIAGGAVAVAAGLLLRDRLGRPAS